MSSQEPKQGSVPKTPLAIVVWGVASLLGLVGIGASIWAGWLIQGRGDAPTLLVWLSRIGVPLGLLAGAVAFRAVRRDEPAVWAAGVSVFYAGLVAAAFTNGPYEIWRIWTAGEYVGLAVLGVIVIAALVWILRNQRPTGN